jgi:hypothetical protein
MTPIACPHFFQHLGGWADQSLLDLYAEAARHFPDGSHFVELGVWEGKSAAYMGVELLNHGKLLTRMDLVDTWEGSANEPAMLAHTAQFDLFSTCWKNLVNGGVRDFFRPVCLPSVRAARAYDDGELDFVFIDAAHDYASVRADIGAWLPKVAKNGWCCGHDYDAASDFGVVKAVDELLPGREVLGRCWRVKV